MTDVTQLKIGDQVLTLPMDGGDDGNLIRVWNSEGHLMASWVWRAAFNDRPGEWRRCHDCR